MGTLALACLTLLPWYTGGRAPAPGGVAGRTAIQSPSAALGIAAALAVAVAVAWLASATLATRPVVPHPGAALRGLAAAALALVIVKLALRPDDLGPGAWGTLLLGMGLLALRLPHRIRGVSRRR